jgi:hypothetical protein
MNKKKILQASLAAIIVVDIIALLFFPERVSSKIVGILCCIPTLILYLYYSAEEKDKTNTYK